MNKLKVRFMYLVIRFMAKFMMYGAEGMREQDKLGGFEGDLVSLGDDLRDVLEKL